MHPSCLAAHAMPRHGNGDRAPCNPTLYPPAPADTRDSAGLSHDAVRGVHARKRNGRRKKEERAESAKRNGENKETLERSGK